MENPIDRDKITETPSTLPYAHTVGGAVIKPNDMTQVKSKSLTAMKQQTKRQYEQIAEQVELLKKQADEIRKREEISEHIYMAKYNFEPIIGECYSLYKKEDEMILSLISPQEWHTCPYEFVAQVKLLSDHTWEIIN